MAGELVSLSEVVAAGAAEDQEPAPGFTAHLDGVEYVVTAVLQRTAALEVPGDRWADKQMAQQERLLVDPAAITWQSKPPRPGPASWRGRRRPVADPQAQRAITDERALVDQAQRAAAQSARPRPRRRPAVTPAPGEVVSGRQSAPLVGSTAVLLPSPRASTPTTPDRIPGPVRELVDRMVWALDRIDELETERERIQGAQRRLIPRARPAMARRVAS